MRFWKITTAIVTVPAGIIFQRAYSIARRPQSDVRVSTGDPSAASVPSSALGGGSPTSFINDSRGVAITLAAFAIPVLLLAVGAGLDYGYLFLQERRLQAAVDAAAISAARELRLASTDTSHIDPVVQGVLLANLPQHHGGVEASATVIRRPLSVRVEATQVPDMFIMDKLAGAQNLTISAQAVARLVGGTSVCVIGLDDSAAGTVSLDSNSELSASSCAVYSNSSDNRGLSSNSNSVLLAALICSAGGADGQPFNFDPEPLTDCPTIEDPLADRPAPPVGSCTAHDREIKDITTTIGPGVYCGGLRIDGNARVHLSPGIYVIKDGPFNVDSNSEIDGEHVAFYLTGAGSTFRFASNAKVTLSAPTDGPLAGLLFFEARNSPPLRQHQILSNYARELVGTIYLPNGRFIIDADNEVADQSAYTAIVARRIELFSGPKLVLNTDYGLTDVPVPDGLGGAGQSVVLTD